MSALRAFFWVASLQLVCGPAHAYIRNITFSPAPVTADQPVHITIDAGVCHAFTGIDATTQINGNVVDLVMDGILEDEPIFCFHPDFTYQFDIGRLPPGNLTVRVNIRNSAAPHQIFPSVLVTQLYVRSPATQLPSGSVLTSLLLILAMSIAGVVKLKRKPMTLAS